MAIPRVLGYPDHTITGDNWIPLLFSGKVLEKFYAKTLATNLTTTDYVGELKNVGDRIRIRTLGSITIKDYHIGQTLDLEYPEGGYIEMQISRAKYFNFAIDDIDIHQADISWLEKYAEDASKQVKIVMDREFFGQNGYWVDAHPANHGQTAGAISGAFNLGTLANPITINRENVLDIIIACQTVLDEQNIPDEERYIVVPPVMWNVMMRSELRASFVSGLPRSTILQEYQGQIGSFDVYVSNLLHYEEDQGEKIWIIPFAIKRAVAWVGQISKVEKYRPHNTFAEAIKGLFVYDFKTLIREGVGYIVAKIDLT